MVVGFFFPVFADSASEGFSRAFAEDALWGTEGCQGRLFHVVGFGFRFGFRFGFWFWFVC